MHTLRDTIRMMLRPRGREAFLNSLAPGATILDVGCGSNSPRTVKTQRPDLYYVGVDIADYDHSSDPNDHADEYIVTAPEKFAQTIAGLGQRFDAVISSHNIEHCNAPENVLTAIAQVLRPRGKLFMAWPAEHTVNLPSRAGCLNFYDDPTHCYLPKFDAVMDRLSKAGLAPVFQAKAYQPIVPFLIGGMAEPVAALMNRQAPLRSTWAFYGFESVVWFSKTKW